MGNFNRSVFDMDKIIWLFGFSVAFLGSQSFMQFHKTTAEMSGCSGRSDILIFGFQRIAFLHAVTFECFQL